MKDYAALYAKVGGAAFAVRVGLSPVLIGIKLVAELDDVPRKTRSGAYETMTLAPIGGAFRRPESIVGRVFLLKPGPGASSRVVIGRFGDKDVMVPDHSVSRHHCAFDIREGRVWLDDCGSSNGTRVGDVKLPSGLKHELLGGEIITIGRLQLRYKTGKQFIAAAKAMSSWVEPQTLLD